AGDPVLYGNLPPREISMKDVFRSGDSSKKFKIAEGQWYRYAPSYVSPAYHLLEGFPFIQEPPSGDLQERVLIRDRKSVVKGKSVDLGGLSIVINKSGIVATCYYARSV